MDEADQMDSVENGEVDDAVEEGDEAAVEEAEEEEAVVEEDDEEAVVEEDEEDVVAEDRAESEEEESFMDTFQKRLDVKEANAKAVPDRKYANRSCYIWLPLTFPPLPPKVKFSYTTFSRILC